MNKRIGILKEFDKNSMAASILLFLLVIAVHLPWIDFYGSAAADTDEYVAITIEWLNSKYINFRPIGYPLLLAIGSVIDSDGFGGIVYLQLLFYALSTVLFFNLLKRFKTGFGILSLSIIVLISFLSPLALKMNEVVLPEMLPLALLLMLYFFLAKEASLKNGISIAVIIIAASLLKPFWLILLILPVLKFFYGKKSRINVLVYIIIPVFSLSAFYSIKSLVLSPMTKHSIKSNTSDMVLNLSLIRMGLIEGSEHTKLYGYLDSIKLIDEIRNRKWSNDYDELDDFKAIKDQIPWRYRGERNFWQRILLYNPNKAFKFFTFKLSRVPIFFSASSEAKNVRFLPYKLNTLYQRFYSNLNSKHIALICFLMFIYYSKLFELENFNFDKYVALLLAVSAITLCVFTYQDPHILRMRAVLEPFIIYITLMSLIKTFQLLLKRFNLKK